LTNGASASTIKIAWVSVVVLLYFEPPPEPLKDLTDHPTFHPCLWLAFGDLDGADFWRNKDRIRHNRFVDVPSGGPGQGSFGVKNQYESDGTIIGTEVAHITICVRPAGYLLLWDSVFTPRDGDLTFGDQEEIGMGVRMATKLAVVNGGRITNSDGLKDESQVWGKPADWCISGNYRDAPRPFRRARRCRLGCACPGTISLSIPLS
jgi:hypothetical protein